MFCSQCGVELSADSIYCFKCGKPVAGQPRIAEPSVGDGIILEHNQTEIVAQSYRPSKCTKKQVFYLVLLALALISVYASVLIPAFGGESVDAKSILFGVIFWNVFAFWYLWKVCNRRGWMGGVVGASVSLLVIMLSVAIGGYERGQPDYVLAHNQAFLAMKNRFPNEYEHLYQELITVVKSKKLTDEDVTGLIGKKIIPLLNKSLETASDSSILLLGKAKLSMFRDVAKVNASDCYALVSGVTDPVTQLRISKYISPETSAQNEEALRQVIADKSWQTLGDNSDMRYSLLLDQLNTVLVSKYSLSITYLTDDAISAEARCQAGIAMWKEAMNLSQPDQVFMLRKFLAP